MGMIWILCFRWHPLSNNDPYSTYVEGHGGGNICKNDSMYDNENPKFDQIKGIFHRHSLLPVRQQYLRRLNLSQWRPHHVYDYCRNTRCSDHQNSGFQSCVFKAPPSNWRQRPPSLWEHTSKYGPRVCVSRGYDFCLCREVLFLIQVFFKCCPLPLPTRLLPSWWRKKRIFQHI